MGEAATASAASLSHPWPPYRDRMSCAPLGRQQWAWQTERKVSAGFAELSPWACGKVRGESAAPGTARPSPEVAVALSLPLGPQQQEVVGLFPPAASWCCHPGPWLVLSSMRQETWKSGAWAGQPHSRVAVSCWAAHTAPETATVGTVTCQFGGRKVPPPGHAEQPWSPRAVVIPEAFGSCRSNLQPLPVEGLALEGALTLGRLRATGAWVVKVLCQVPWASGCTELPPAELLRDTTTGWKCCGLAPTPHSGGPGCGPWWCLPIRAYFLPH